MFEKIIIENRTELSMTLCLEMVTSVIKGGKISKTSKGEQYCFGTEFSITTPFENEKEGHTVKYMVLTDKNKKSDRFVIDKA